MSNRLPSVTLSQTWSQWLEAQTNLIHGGHTDVALDNLLFGIARIIEYIHLHDVDTWDGSDWSRWS